MKNWLRRKLQSFLYMDSIEDVCISVNDSNGIDWPDPLRFQVQKANGGTIIEVTHYDRKSDQRHHSVHVIADSEDLQNSIAKIITYESLKK